jgi:hypothetical protein
MSKEADVGRSITRWLTKAQTMPQPPDASEARGNIARRDPPPLSPAEPIKQLNLKIPQSTYDRMRELKRRDRTTFLAMLDHMLDLYEREHGKLQK